MTLQGTAINTVISLGWIPGFLGIFNIQIVKIRLYKKLLRFLVPEFNLVISSEADSVLERNGALSADADSKNHKIYLNP